MYKKKEKRWGRKERREGKVGGRVKLCVQQRTGYILRHARLMVVTKDLQLLSGQEKGGDRKHTGRKPETQSPPTPTLDEEPFLSPLPQLCQGAQCLHSLAGKHVGMGLKALLGH